MAKTNENDQKRLRHPPLCAAGSAPERTPRSSSGAARWGGMPPAAETFGEGGRYPKRVRKAVVKVSGCAERDSRSVDFEALPGTRFSAEQPSIAHIFSRAYVRMRQYSYTC